MKKSKSWDMRLHWFRDRENQKQFNIIWSKREHNCADYHTKHHPITYHRKMRQKYIRDAMSNLTSHINFMSKHKNLSLNIVC